MPDSDFEAQARAVQTAITELQQLGSARHQLGDRAARVAQTAPSRRDQRNALNLNAKTRAVGTAVEASLWLFCLMQLSFAQRSVSPAAGFPALDRFCGAAKASIDDLDYEAAIAHAYPAQPAQAVRRRR